MAFHRVCPATELGEPRSVLLDGRDILLTSIDGLPHAIADVCPHNAARLSDGMIRDGCVTCPAHLWRFSLVDGAKQGSPDVRVQVFATRIADDGWIEIDVPPAPPARSLRETLLAHARGEAVDAP